MTFRYKKIKKWDLWAGIPGYFLLSLLFLFWSMTGNDKFSLIGFAVLGVLMIYLSISSMVRFKYRNLVIDAGAEGLRVVYNENNEKFFKWNEIVGFKVNLIFFYQEVKDSNNKTIFIIDEDIEDNETLTNIIIDNVFKRVSKMRKTKTERFLQSKVSPTNIPLRKRWKIEPYNTVSKNVDRCARKGNIHELANTLGFVNDRIDLRGYTFTGIIKNYKLSNCDLTYAVMDNVWLEKSTFDNVVFKNIVFDNLSDHGNSFNNCVFVNCLWTTSVLGYDSSRYTGCDFINARFKETSFIKAELYNCKFLKSKMTCLDFNVSYFENVVFEGEFYDVMFRGEYPVLSDLKDFGFYRKNEMKNVDFSKAEIKFLAVRDGIKLSSVIIPKDKYIFLIHNFEEFSDRAYNNVESFFEGANLKSAKIYFEVLADEAKDGKQKDYIINLRDAQDRDTSDDFLDLLLLYLKKIELL